MPEAPPPLSKPPRLLHFVEADAPASLAEGERAEPADVMLTHRRRRAGARHGRRRRAVGGGRAGRGRRSRRHASSRSSPPRRAASRCRCGSTTRITSRPSRRPRRWRRRPSAAATGGAHRAARRRRAAQGRSRADRRRHRDRRRNRARGDGRGRPVRVRRRSRRARSRCSCAARRSGPPTRRSRSRPASGCSRRSTPRRRSVTPPSCAVGARWSRPSSRRLQAEEIKHIPGTQGDTLKAVQNLPGVARAPYGIGLLAGVGLLACRHARLHRRRQHPHALPLRRSALDGEQRDGRRADVRARRLQGRPRPRAGRHHRRADPAPAHRRLPRLRAVRSARRLGDAGGAADQEAVVRGGACGAAGSTQTLPYFTTSSLQLSPVYWDYQARLSYRPDDARHRRSLFCWARTTA